MTDDEIGEALRLDFEQITDWRRPSCRVPRGQSKPGGGCTLAELAAWVGPSHPPFLMLMASLRDASWISSTRRNAPADGFPLVTRTAEDFVEPCIARAGRWERTVQETPGRGRRPPWDVAESAATGPPRPAIVSPDCAPPLSLSSFEAGTSLGRRSAGKEGMAMPASV